MRRKKHNKVKPQKEVVFDPFENADNDYMIPFDEEYHCVQDGSDDIENMSLEDLQVLEDSLVENICDYDTIIEMQIDPNKSTVGFDKENLRMDRKRRQAAIVELRTVRDRIKMLKYDTSEVAIAV